VLYFCQLGALPGVVVGLVALYWAFIYQYNLIETLRTQAQNFPLWPADIFTVPGNQLSKFWPLHSPLVLFFSLFAPKFALTGRWGVGFWPGQKA